MKKLLLPFLLLFSVNIFANDIPLDTPFVNLGYLESVNGLPFDQTFSFVRTEATPDSVVLNFSYTQVEMICEDRIPDGGGWGGGYYGGGPVVVAGDTRTSGHEKFRSSFSHHSHDVTINHNGYDRNFMGICRHWGEMETQKSGRVKLVFKAAYENESGDIVKVNIHQRDLHSTAFWVSGWCPGYEVTNYASTIIFE
ncbi:MAG: hypothetical protein ACHQYQ_07380 [Bacteriovoracales bacterium]